MILIFFCFSSFLAFVLGAGHLLVGGWAEAKGVGIIPFCVPENGGLHKIVQPFLGGHDVFCLPFSVPQKRNNTEGIKASKILFIKMMIQIAATTTRSRKQF